MSKYEVGQRVEFHGQWPWHIYTGRVVAIRTDDKFGNSGLGADIAWDADCVGPASQSFVPFWNSRLRPA